MCMQEWEKKKKAVKGAEFKHWQPDSGVVWQTGSCKLPGGFLGMVRNHRGRGARLHGTLNSIASHTQTSQHHFKAFLNLNHLECRVQS